MVWCRGQDYLHSGSASKLNSQQAATARGKRALPPSDSKACDSIRVFATATRLPVETLALEVWCIGIIMEGIFSIEEPSDVAPPEAIIGAVRVQGRVAVKVVVAMGRHPEAVRQHQAATWVGD